MSKKHDRKHLTLSQRVMIEKGLDNNESFTMIAAKIGKDPITVSKEVLRHLSHYTKHENGRAIPCTLHSDCQRRTMCGDSSCPIICRIRRRVRYKVRKKPTRVSLSAREFRIGRGYDDFQKLLKENPSLPVVEMDTVEGGSILMRSGNYSM